MKYYHLKSVI